MLLAWILFGFILGSLPFSVWLGRYGLKKEITQFGDGNPGATNVLRAGGFLWFSLALALDISKAAVPVGLAYQIYGIQDWRIVPIALAPTLGHMFSPLLAGRGGKALATAFGVWIAMDALHLALPIMLFVIIWSLLIRPSGWAVLLSLLMFGGYMWWRQLLPIPMLMLLAQAPFLLFKQIPELRQMPTLKFGRKPTEETP